MTKKGWLFVSSLIGMSVSAALLIWLIPALFGSDEQRSVWVYGTVAGLTGIFAVGTRHWRPSRQPRTETNPAADP